MQKEKYVNAVPINNSWNFPLSGNTNLQGNHASLPTSYNQGSIHIKHPCKISQKSVNKLEPYILKDKYKSISVDDSLVKPSHLVTKAE